MFQLSAAAVSKRLSGIGSVKVEYSFSGQSMPSRFANVMPSAGCGSELPLPRLMRFMRNAVSPIWSDSSLSVWSKFGSPAVGMPSPSPASCVPGTPSAPTSSVSAFQSRSSSPVHHTSALYAGRFSSGP